MTIRYEVMRHEGAEIMVNRFVLDSRLKFPQNWTSQDMEYAYFDNGNFDQKTVGVYSDRDEAFAAFDALCKECKSGYFWNNHVPFVKFDVVSIDAIDDDENIETIAFYIAEQEKDDE